ncbi:serine/threonine protein kinase [Limnoglobus roseus]|uniref:mitogen-activated protein kinase kinase n=1 Tax=Limnoglobus roseus TaxID=2598579 RepID=A0A5C1AL77_9BACT|nr:serine/threonine-protein kinase [Limnoglobus roseus]QEL18482.1 serine/threonine protein kinase [Limnoglobus roseus]
MSEMKTTINGYKLRSLLQTGAVSQVYEVVEPTSHRHFAMKVLLPEQADNKQHRAQLFHEAEIGIKMRHENVINILKVSKDMQTPHFIMEFFPSGSLRPRLLSRDPKDKEFIKVNSRKIFKQMATGLAYMNAGGYVHCDVKADNVLVNALGQTKIIDFAITKKMKKGFFEKLFGGKEVREGTKSYMSPEQILRQPLDGRSDVYSFGATWYELATGRQPFRAASQDELLQKHLREKPAPLTMYNDDVTPEFSNFVLKMMEKKKENRPDNFHKILMDMKKMRIFKSIADEAEEDPHY